MKRELKAFSMVEISMVLVLLTAIMLGIVQTTSLINDARLTRAQSLTKNSPVKDVNGLVLWLETSLEESFILDEAIDTELVSTWYDRKNNDLEDNHATQNNSSNQPRYIATAFYDSIAGVRFDGSNDFMGFDGNKIINSSYTIFVVEKRTSAKSSNYFIAGTSTTNNQNLILGYDSDTSISHSHHNNSISHSVAAYSNDVTRIHTFKFDMSGKEYFLNGGLSANASDSNTNPLGAYVGATIGRYLSGTQYYEGDIGEIIIFNRSLSNKDRTLIEEYLGKKYGIKIN